MVKSRNQQAVQATSSPLLPWGPAILLFSCVIHAHASSSIISHKIISDRRPLAASNLRFPDRPKALPPLLKASLRTVLSPLSRARRKKFTFSGADSLLPSTSCSFPVPSLLACRGGSTGATPAQASSSPRNRTAEWEEDAAWLTNQVLTYQAHMALSAEALGKRHAVVGDTPFDFGFKHEEKYRPPLEIVEASPLHPYECRIHGEVDMGAKLVAPCLCRGTGKWMWFADMNRRRRRDPLSSRECGTCHAKIDYQAYQRFGSVLAQLVSWPLDHALTFRCLLLASFVFSSVLFVQPLSILVIRVLTSSLFWRQHSLWARVVYGPLPLKIVMYKYVGQLLWSYFLRAEGAVRETLAEAESILLERALPVTVVAEDKE